VTYIHKTKNEESQEAIEDTTQKEKDEESTEESSVETVDDKVRDENSEEIQSSPSKVSEELEKLPKESATSQDEPEDKSPAESGQVVEEKDVVEEPTATEGSEESATSEKAKKLEVKAEKEESGEKEKQQEKEVDEEAPVEESEKENPETAEKVEKAEKAEKSEKSEKSTKVEKDKKEKAEGEPKHHKSKFGMFRLGVGKTSARSQGVKLVGIIPSIPTSNIDSSIAFYEALGFAVVGGGSTSKLLSQAGFTLSLVHCNDAHIPASTSYAFAMIIESPERLHATLTEKGVLVSELKEKSFSVKDPTGVTILIRTRNSGSH